MKYIDNYILSILLGLELGKTINFNSIDDLPEQIRTNEDRRLEKNFIGKLKDTVLNALPQAEQDKLLSKTKYSIDKDSINVGISASEMNLQTLDDVLKYIETSNNDFPIAKAPDTTEILTGLQQYVEAITKDCIEGNTVIYIRWQYRVKKFLKMLDKEQLLNNYTFDNGYIKYISVLLYGYVNNLISFNDYNIVLKQIPFCYECEGSIEPVPKNITNTDNESDYIDLYANADITKLYEDLTKSVNTNIRPTPSKKEDTHGFSKRQWKLVKKVVLAYENFNIDEISFDDIRSIMCRSKRHVTDKKKIAQNHISKINDTFNDLFGYQMFDRCYLTSDSYPLCDDFRNNFDTVIRKLGLEEVAIQNNNHIS